MRPGRPGACRRLPALWAVCLALVFLAVAPLPVGGDMIAASVPQDAMAGDAPGATSATDTGGGAVHPCAGNGAGSGPCPTAQHHCAACVVAVFAPPMPAGGDLGGPPRPVVPLPALHALPAPDVPHGPPRLA